MADTEDVEQQTEWSNDKRLLEANWLQVLTDCCVSGDPPGLRRPIIAPNGIGDQG